MVFLKLSIEYLRVIEIKGILDVESLFVGGNYDNDNLDCNN